MNPSDNFHIILARAENPANIGQIARVMKNFGFNRLSLVNCGPHQSQEAYTLGWHAKEILDEAEVSESLQGTIRGAALTVGFTRRQGRWRGEPRSIHHAIARICEVAHEQKVALIFGNEKNGLSNEELSFCHELVTIPTSETYSSLNLSHAVAVTLFAIVTHLGSLQFQSRKPERFYATPEEFDDLIRLFSVSLIQLGYGTSPRADLLRRTEVNIANFIRRAGLEKREYHMFKALLLRLINLKENGDNIDNITRCINR